MLILTPYHGESLDAWLLAEKLNGIRAAWTGTQLLTRNGRSIAAPSWWLATLPAMPLDGELYAGRDTLAFVAGAVRRKTPRDAEWARITYHVFDSPGAGRFAERLTRANAAIIGCGIAAPVPHHAAGSTAAALAWYHKMIAGGAEGIVARDPAGWYDDGQSQAALKLKPGEGMPH